MGMLYPSGKDFYLQHSVQIRSTGSLEQLMHEDKDALNLLPRCRMFERCVFMTKCLATGKALIFNFIYAF
jgi:hypothetical protein